MVVNFPNLGTTKMPKPVSSPDTSRDRPQAAAATAGRGPGEDEGRSPALDRTSTA